MTSFRRYGRDDRRKYDWAIEEYRNGAKLQDLAKKAGISRVWMLLTLRSRGVKLRDERVKIDEEEAAALYAQGMLMKDIALRYNSSLPAVSLALKRQKVKTRARHESSDASRDTACKPKKVPKPRPPKAPKETVHKPKRHSIFDLIGDSDSLPSAKTERGLLDEFEDFIGLPDHLAIEAKQTLKEFQKDYAKSMDNNVLPDNDLLEIEDDDNEDAEIAAAFEALKRSGTV